MRRAIVMVAVLCAAVFVGLRILERVMTFRPTGYDKSTNWNPPAAVQEEWVRASDGTRLHTWLFPAKGTPRGFILYSHGNGGNLLGVRAIATNFAERGYNVMLWDYRGYGRSEGSLSHDEATFLGDADAVFRHLKSKTGQPIIVWGQSLGTTVSADLCTHHECAALILESGLSSANEFARTQVWFVPRFLHGVAQFVLRRRNGCGTCIVLS